MKEFTREKVFTYFDELYPTATIKVNPWDGGWEVTIDQMYDYVDVSFKRLVEISNHFGTTNIEMDKWAAGGCNSCDYGSKYEVELQIGCEDNE